MNLWFGVIFAAATPGIGASECAWYIVNFTISTIAGIFWLFLAMRLWSYLVEQFGLELLRSGE